MHQVVLLVISTAVQMKRKHQAFGDFNSNSRWVFSDLGNWVFVEAVIGFSNCYFGILEVAAMVISAIMESTHKCGSSNLSHHGTDQNCCHCNFDRG
jgi:hypothetical protein